MRYQLLKILALFLNVTLCSTLLYECDKRAVPCGCGYNNVAISPSRIIGGEDAVPYSWSMVVSLRFDGTNINDCGGSILSESYILTAAHCVEEESSSSPDGVSIAAGIHNQSDDNAQVRQVDRIYIHPNWSLSTIEHLNDIAILHLSEPLDFTSNPFVKRTCVPQIESFVDVTQYPPNGTRLVAIGWGATVESDIRSNPDNLQQAEVFVIDNNDTICVDSIYDIEKQFCAGLYQGGKDTCQGDSGGPILYWKGNHWEQVGITSYGRGCGDIGQPGVYTRLANYLNWIQSITIDSFVTTAEPPKQIIYKCNRIPGQCGCSLTDVAFSTHNQQSMPTIVDRHDAFPYSWSMMVSVRMNGERHSCGGTILSDSFILTAAQCVRNASRPVDIAIAAGIHTLSEYATVVRRVDRVHLHPSYVYDERHLHDIAILHLDRPLDLSSQPLLAKTCVPDLDLALNRYLLDNSSLVVIGWGSSTVGGNFSDVLQQVSVKLIDNQHTSCRPWILSDTDQFCAGLSNDGKVSCRGDVGGPIFIFKNDRWEQVGIVSNGHGCIVPDRPRIYTKLSAYVDWIDRVMHDYRTTTSGGRYKYEQNVFTIVMLVLVVFYLY